MRTHFPSCSKRNLTITIVVLAVISGLVPAARIKLNRAYEEAVTNASSLYHGCRKAWAHRGYVAKHPENSIGSVKHAFALGASGVEVDIRYDRPSGRFVVSHDYPYKKLNDQDQLLMLDRLLDKTGGLGYFWLDAKNFGSLWPWEAAKAANYLAGLIQRHGLQDQVLVESRNPLYLAWLGQQGIHTSYMISPNEKDYSPLVFWVNIYLIKLSYTWGAFSALSMNDYRYTQKVAQALGDRVAIHVSTVNDWDRFIHYAHHPNIRVILTDRDYFEYDSCQTITRMSIVDSGVD